MKRIQKSILFILCISLFTATSCRDHKKVIDDDDVNEENQRINNWIYGEMEIKYFWNTYLPSLSSLDRNADPGDFYYSMLYYEKDEFSTIDHNGILQEGPYAASENIDKRDRGFEYSVIWDGVKVYGLCVLYVKKGSSAEKQGLKRGDLIKKVNNSSSPEEGWYSALGDGNSSYKLEFYNREPMTLNTDSHFEENPVYYARTFDEGKIGYIVYNFFDNDNGNDSYDYALEMNNELTKMSEVEFLILDLRYNGGGLVESGAYIASALVPDRGAGGNMNVYTRRNFNDTYDAILRKGRYYDRQVTEYFHDKIVNIEIPRLRLKKLYVLTTGSTASASEQIINGLRAYMDVEVIGTKTRGKNMESIPISDEKKHKWELHPLVSVSFRHDQTPATNDYSTGFDPTLPSEKESTKDMIIYMNYNGNLYTENVYQLGEEKEALLSEALKDIRGISEAPVPARMKRSIPQDRIELEEIGSSLDLKPKQMVIKIKE